MRLLVLTSSYPTAANRVASAFLEDWVEALRHRGHSVAVSAPADACIPSGPKAGVSEETFFHYLPWPQLQTLAYGAGMYDNVRRNPWRLLQLPAFLRGQYRAARELASGADLVHAHWLFPAGLAGALVKRRTGIPLVITVHSTDLHLLRRAPYGAALARFVIGQADRLHFVSHHHRRLLQDWLGEAALPPSYVMPMGVHEAFVAEPPVPLRSPPRVGFIGRLIPVKGVDRLLRACAALSLEDVWIAGHGPDRDDLARLAKSLRVNARFVGTVAQEAKRAFIDSCDLRVFPSPRYPTGRGEGVPVSLLESLSRGRVTVASDSGGIPDIIRHGDNGYLFASEQESALRDTLQNVVSNWPVSRAAGARGRQSVLDFAVSTVARAHESVYADAVSAAARVGRA